MNAKVNWGSIFAGAVVAMGCALLLSYFSSAFSASVPGTQNPNFTPTVDTFSGIDAALAVIFSIVAFGAAGFTTTLLGRFPSMSQAVVHALVAFATAALAAHFLARGAPFVGRPGYPFTFFGAPGLPSATYLPLTPIVAFTRFLSCILGAGGSAAAGYFTFAWTRRRPLSATTGSGLSEREAA